MPKSTFCLVRHVNAHRCITCGY